LTWPFAGNRLELHLLPGWHSTAIAEHPDVVAGLIERCLQRAQREE
jgi:hypothetical protein